MSESNGAQGRDETKVRVAIVGVGNCANSFIQGVEYYKNADPNEEVPGLMHVDLGGYHVRDVEFVAAFDIDQEKVGKDLSEAIWSGQNDTIKFADVPNLGITVQRGMTHDGLGKYLKEKITKAPGETVDVVQVLKDSKADVVVCYLPVGSEDATKWYVEQAMKAGVGVVNCLPVFIAREDYWDKQFEKAGLPIIGDDIKSQVGATIVHRQLARLFHDRGVRLERTSQLNVGGNMDFYNMLERERLDSKKISKTNAVTSIMGHDLPPENVHVGPSDYVPWLTDRKWAHIRLEGKAFGDVPLTAELKLEVWDSPNSAGVVIDAVRLIKLALNNGIAGQLDGPSSYLMKSPHSQRPDDEARELTEEFIEVNARGVRDGGRVGNLRLGRLGPSSRSLDKSPLRRALIVCASAFAPVTDDRPGLAAPADRPQAGQRVRRSPERGASAARARGGADRQRRAGQAAAERASLRHRPRARAVRPERLGGGAAPLAVAERGDLPRAAGAGALDPGGAAAGGDLLRPDRRPHRHQRGHREAAGGLLPGRATS